MKNISKILVIAALILSFYTLYAARCTLCFAEEQKPESARNEIVVSVNGVGISEAEVQMAIDVLIPRSLFHRTVTSEKREQFRKPAIDSLIERELLYHEAKRLGLSIKKAEIKEVFNKSKESFKKKKDFNDALKKQGLTEESYKKLIEKELLVKRFLKQEVEDKAGVGEEDLEKYYNENKKRFFAAERIKLLEMSVTVPATATKEERENKKKKAEELLNRLKAGEDFSEVAYNYSEDDYRVKGGDLGWVHKGRLEPGIEDAALKLKIGEISGLIETIYGYHIVKLEEKKPAEQLSFSEVKDSLKKELETKKHKELKETLINALKEKAVIKIF